MLTLRRYLSSGPVRKDCAIRDRDCSIALADLASGSNLSLPPAAFLGRSVLIATRGQMPMALALFALDGVARRIVLAPPDIAQAALQSIVRQAESDLVITDGNPDGEYRNTCGASTAVQAVTGWPNATVETEWVLATSGTTGTPKLVVHSLEGLAGAIPRASVAPGTVWSTFYDIRRYGGLQVFLRAVLGATSLVLSDPDEPVGAFLDRAAQASTTHILGTPSHWRLALMSPALARLDPRYVRLSGEIADQGILDRLNATFPRAVIAHAYASTEAGVGFSVEDGLAGFPAAHLGARAGTELIVRNDTLHVRSSRTGRQYLGEGTAPLVGADGFVDTGDRVELRGDRYYFLGRSSGLINVGGAKVQPEEVEAVLNCHPRVSSARVRGRRSPILGSLVVADLVPAGALSAGEDRTALIADILAFCRQELAPYKVPARINFVGELPLTASGKLVREAP